MKDFSKVRYLKFSADDPYECTFKDVIIDLVEDKMIYGFITIGSIEDGDERITFDVEHNLSELQHGDKFSIFAKVVDSGVYYLLDENMNEVFISEGYVPRLMDYYNVERGFGDYIELKFDDINTGKLWHQEQNKISYNDEDEWNEVQHKSLNLYEKGMLDAFALVKRTLTNAKTPDIGAIDVLSLIVNFENKSSLKN